MPSGYIGIDAGTQGLTAIFVDQQLQVIAAAESSYSMIDGLQPGEYEQFPGDWESAMAAAINQLLQDPAVTPKADVLAIGIAGQMHGEVLVDSGGQVLQPARLWCDSRNEAESEELTDLLGIKMPKRMTAVRWLWTVRNRPEIASRTSKFTTPAGWLAYRLTGDWNLGIGDASGMFPIDHDSLEYDRQRLQSFQQIDDIARNKSLIHLLPDIRLVGQRAGSLSKDGASLLGLPEGIPIAAAEGDQPAAMAGSLVAEPGMVAVSFGTSVCANSIGDQTFRGIDSAVDHFCAVDGKPINMVFLRNGTTFMNSVADQFTNSGRTMASLMKEVVESAIDCEGVLALPFIDDEPGLGVHAGGQSGLHGLTEQNEKPGNMIRAALLATIFNLKTGLGVLDRQDFDRREIVLTGGLVRTPELGQIVADVLETPVRLPATADEGTAFGAALLGAFRFSTRNGETQSWSEFIAAIDRPDICGFAPIRTNVAVYRQLYQRYQKLLTDCVQFG